MERETAGWKIFRIILSLPFFTVASLVWHDVPVGSELRTLPQLAATIASTLLFTGILGLVRLRRDRKPGAVPANQLAWFAAAMAISLSFAFSFSCVGRALNVWKFEARDWEYAQTKTGSEGWHGYLYSKDPGSRYDQAWWLETFTPVDAHYAEAKAKYGEAYFVEVMATQKLADLRKFRQECPGLHEAETRAPIAAQYQEAAQKYEALIAGKNTHAESVKGLRALFTWLAEHDVDSAVVPVTFLPFESLKSGDFEDGVKARTGAKEVSPVSPSFHAALNEQRSSAVVQSMNDAIAPIVGELFKLGMDWREGASRARFLVGEKVHLSGKLYSKKEDDEKPISEKTIFVGIAMTFDCTIQLPEGEKALDDDLSHGFHFQRVATPAPDFTAYGKEVDGTTVYNAMAGSAFDDFRDQLLKAYGL